jgi:hypothetical protein
MKINAIAQIVVKSPDRKTLFFLPEKSDRRELLFRLRKVEF